MVNVATTEEHAAQAAAPVETVAVPVAQLVALRDLPQLFRAYADASYAVRHVNMEHDDAVVAALTALKEKRELHAEISVILERLLAHVPAAIPPAPSLRGALAAASRGTA